MTSNIIFKPLSEENLALLHQWFQYPHIKQWYARGELFTYEMIKNKYLPRIRNPQYIANFMIYVDGEAAGYIQLYHLSHYLPEGINDDTHELLTDFKREEIAGLDLFIAEEKYLGSGLGGNILTLFIDNYIKAKFKAIIVDPVMVNKRAISFFAKNGFKRMTHDADCMNQLMLYKI